MNSTKFWSLLEPRQTHIHCPLWFSQVPQDKPPLLERVRPEDLLSIVGALDCPMMQRCWQLCPGKWVHRRGAQAELNSVGFVSNRGRLKRAWLSVKVTLSVRVSGPNPEKSGLSVSRVSPDRLGRAGPQRLKRCLKLQSCSEFIMWTTVSNIYRTQSFHSAWC